MEKIRDSIAHAQTIVFARFNAVTSEEANGIREACAGANVGYTVAKKTLIKKAFESAEYEGEFPSLEGEIALAYGDDMLAPARMMGEQGEKVGGRLSIVGGVFEGAFISGEKMEEIAKIPTIETLYVRLLTVIRAPLQGIASVFDQIAEKKGGA